jgi:hypothetical protein
MNRFSLFAFAVLASLPLAGSATSTAGAATVRELAGGPLALARLGPFRGYRVVVEAATMPAHAVVAVEFTRTEGTATQTTTFTFNVPRIALRISRDLRSAALDTGSAIGSFGRIRLTFSCRRRAPGGAGSPCLGSTRARSGTLTGAVDFRTRFGRIQTSSLPAKLITQQLPGSATGGILGGQPSSGRPNCRQYPHAAVLAVMPGAKATARSFALATFLAARQGSGPIALLAAAIRRRPPATEVAGIEATVPRSALALNGTRAARFDGTGIPFLSGGVGFMRTGSLPGCTARAAVGAASGSLRAHLDFFGTVSLLSATREGGAILIGPA